jgi:hypothetical protein
MDIPRLRAKKLKKPSIVGQGIPRLPINLRIKKFYSGSLVRARLAGS